MLRAAPYPIIAVAALLSSAWFHDASAQATGVPALPQHLHETGLFADLGTAVDAKNLAFAPQYPLWSDGAHKRRWIYLPPGTAIDASRPDAWQFPVGTRLWKEFSLGRVIETRFIERLADGTWRFAAYVWNEAGTDASLAPREGMSLAVPTAPQGRYAIPAQDDCRACHEGAAVPVLGFSALQLSSDRDPLAPHAEANSALGLADLVARGLIRNLPASLISDPPRIAATSVAERASLGYLHGNCSHCHNDSGAPAPVDLVLAQRVTDSGSTERVLRSMIDGRVRFRGHGLGNDAPLIAPGNPQASVLIARMRSRNPSTQMPPIGTQAPDVEALALIERWIAEKSSQKSSTPQELKP
jgi:hypothetical protein